MNYYKITTRVVNSESGGETPPTEGLKIYAHRTSSLSSYSLDVNGTKTFSTSNNNFPLRAVNIPDGWEFVSWVCESDRDATYTTNPSSDWRPSNNPGTSVGSATKCTVTLRLKKTIVYTLSYNANGGTGAPEPTTAEEGIFSISEETPTRSGFYFLGWALTPTAEVAEYAPGQNIEIHSDVTLYAVWALEPDPGPGPGPTPHSGYLIRNKSSDYLVFVSSGHLAYD